MQRHGIARANLVEHVQRTTAADHEVFGDHLDEIDGRLALQEVGVVRRTQPKSKAMERGERQGSHR
jgi:hypothetical protein